MRDCIRTPRDIWEVLTDERTQKFTKEVLTHMRNRLSDYQEEYPGELFNLEATPAESTAYRLAKHDRKRWPDIRTAGSKGDTPYYTNSSHLPVEFSSDIFDALDIQDELVYFRNCIPWSPRRETSGLESSSISGTQDRRELQTAVLHDLTYLLRMQGTWLSER